jgi:DNA-binding transcriptional ArsR family regulator
MMDEAGNFVGQICHIEAAKTGGQRFNSDMSDDDRRDFSNLILMCHRHHVVTDDVHTYTASMLREMKSNHEQKYSQLVEKMSATITDQALEGELVPAQNLGRIFQDGDPNLSTFLNKVNSYGASLRELPASTREVLAIAVRRATEQAERDSDRGGIGSMTINPGEVHKATGLSMQDFREHLRILEDHGLASLEDADGNGRFLLYISGHLDECRIPEEIVHACKEGEIPLEDVYVGLRFDRLDRS